MVICTDHAAIQWSRTTPKPMAQADRWLAIMEKFDFTVQHRAGSKHQNADFLKFIVRKGGFQLSDRLG